MRFRSPTEEPVSVGLTSGHMAVVPPEGIELEQRFVKEAIAAGCLPEGSSSDDEKVKGGPSRFELIAATMNAMLDKSDADDFTKDGKIDLKRLQTKVGFAVARSEADAVWAEVSKAD